MGKSKRKLDLQKIKITKLSNMRMIRGGTDGLGFQQTPTDQCLPTEGQCNTEGIADGAYSREICDTGRRPGAQG